MKPLVALGLAASLCLGGAALAGGPVIVEEEGEPEVVAEIPRSGWIVPVVVGLVVVCAIACGGGDEPPGDDGGDDTDNTQ